MKHTPFEWSKIQQRHMEREAARNKRTTIMADGNAKFAATPQMIFHPEAEVTPRQPRRYKKRHETDQDLRTQRRDAVATVIKRNDEAAVVELTAAKAGLSFELGKIPQDRRDAALIEIVKLTDAALFISWSGIRNRIREIALEALGPKGGKA